MEYHVKNVCEYLIGIDGGGTGTRALLQTADGRIIGSGQAGPSALGQGIAQAWTAIMEASVAAFAQAGLSMPALEQIGIGLGLSGVHNKLWAAEFSAQNPGFGEISLCTDAYTTLLGAHQGKPGVIIAIGTGSVGEALLADGSSIEVGGWGFPSSDEASGAWLGLRAINHIQHVLDGRSPASAFAAAVIAHCGGDRDAVFKWLAQANQHSYAKVAPLVLEYASRDAVAAAMLEEAGRQIAKMAHALDPGKHLPIALCGGLAAPLQAYLPDELRLRIVPAQADSASGALILIKSSLTESVPC
jgi:glucosamine kinase